MTWNFDVPVKKKRIKNAYKEKVDRIESSIKHKEKKVTNSRINFHFEVTKNRLIWINVFGVINKEWEGESQVDFKCIASEKFNNK